MKKIIYIVLFCSQAFIVKGQSNIRVNNFWEDTYFINPASIHYAYPSCSKENYWQFCLAARKQWTNFPGAPFTGVFTGTTFFNKFDTQLGISLIEDNIGYTNTLNAKISYSYMHDINDLWNIRFGIALCGQNRSYDFSQITTDNTFIPPENTLETITRPNADFGLEFVQGAFLIGISSQNIFSLFNPKSNNIFINSNFLYASYLTHNRSYFDYSFGVAAIETANIIQMEGYVNLYVKSNSSYSSAYRDPNNAFNIGLYYRTWNEIGLVFGFDLSREWYVSYAYDYNLGSVSQSSYGTHELILRYRFQPRFCY